jgi:putative spermidine/putrescine transport system permease protein
VRRTRPWDALGPVANVALWGFTALLLLFLVAPSLTVIVMSFNTADLLIFPPPGYSLRWYTHFFSRPEWLSAAQNSFVIAVATTLVSTIVGMMAALGLVRGRFPGRPMVTALFLTPMVVPVIVTAVAMYGLYARLRLVGTVGGMVMGHTVLALPFVIINVSAVLQGMDWRLEQAARSLGASPLRAFLLVTVPLIRPGIVAAAMFAFVTSFDDLVVALFVSGTRAVTLPVRMWAGIQFELNPAVAAVSAMLIVVSVLALAAVELVRRRR